MINQLKNLEIYSMNLHMQFGKIFKQNQCISPLTYVVYKIRILMGRSEHLHQHCIEKFNSVVSSICRLLRLIMVKLMDKQNDVYSYY